MSKNRGHISILLAMALLPIVAGLCPVLNGLGSTKASTKSLPDWHPKVPLMKKQPVAGYEDAVRALDIHAVMADLKVLFKTSQPQWPADYGHYGPFFVRLAWHCSGSYRTTDGRGGCAGGRQRFDPERSWDDNTNLDKARALLWPIKQKYGLGLSWGDLFILAGTTAIQSMGGPILGFCAGRVDDDDGEWSQELGPTPEQESFAPCPINGQCQRPLGSSTIGLIYLNPEGPMGKPLPNISAGEVRDTFGRMAMNDTETVALIGGGHAFGKTHGACPLGAGPSPKEDPFNPWPGRCGTGKGADAFTSGFEGPWTTNPISWDNTYFKNLVDHQWESHKGPGGKFQWRVKAGKNPVAPAAHGQGTQDTMMLTSDVSLMHDPTGRYQPIVKQFAEDPAAFDNAFSHAWYKLTTRDMGPVQRCVGNLTPPAQPFQYPLPPPPKNLADFDQVKKAIEDSQVAGSHAGLLVRAAWQCANTFRVSDYQGGCNGARIRFSPQKDWPVNADLQKAWELLEPIKESFSAGLSWSDLIVFSANVALEKAGGITLPFCSGRTDALNGVGSQYLAPRVFGNETDTIEELKQTIKLLGLSVHEYAALVGGTRVLAQAGEYPYFNGTWVPSPGKLDNTFFKTLLSEEWSKFKVPETGKTQYKAVGKDLFMLKIDLMFKVDPELQVAAQDYALDDARFTKDFADAWVKLMNADRFVGPTTTGCQDHHHHHHHHQ